MQSMSAILAGIYTNRLFNLRNVFYKEEETKTEHAIGLYPRKTIYLDILTMHTQLLAKYVTYCLLF